MICWKVIVNELQNRPWEPSAPETKIIAFLTFSWTLFLCIWFLQIRKDNWELCNMNFLPCFFHTRGVLLRSKIRNVRHTALCFLIEKKINKRSQRKAQLPLRTAAVQRPEHMTGRSCAVTCVPALTAAEEKQKEPQFYSSLKKLNQ